MNRARALEIVGGLGALGTFVLTAIGLFGGQAERTAESIIIFSPVLLIGVVLYLHQRHAGLWGNRLSTGLGLLGTFTLVAGSLISLFRPEPPTEALWYTVLMMGLISGIGCWHIGANLIAIRNRTLPPLLSLVGIIAGISLVILLFSSIEVWQSLWPGWLLFTNILVWTASNGIWRLWIGIYLLWSALGQPANPHPPLFAK